MRHIWLLLLLPVLLLAEDISKELYSKPKLTTEQIADKQTGSYFTGLPLVNYDADKGFGYGARVYWYDNGNRESELFELTPYNHQLYAQFFQTTNGWSYHVLHYDAPYIGDSLFRLTGEIVYEKNTQANYFGTTSDSMNDLTDTLGNSYTTAQEQQDALDAQGSRYYNRYLLVKPKVEINLARDFFGGLVRLSVGVNLARASITDYNNTTVLDKHNELSKLAEDQDSLIGYEGGWDNGLKLAAVYDSRDFAPNPKNGSIHDFSVGLYGKLLGSDFEHQRYTFSTRNFFTPESADYFTLAVRGIYSVQTGDTPFFDLNILDFADDHTTGLGGYRTLRGYQQDRFVADVKVLANVETRFNFYKTDTLGQTFDFMAVPFVDAGKVFDSVSETDLKGYRYTYGAGLRIAWNQATIIMIDYGQSVEDSGLYINFSHIF
ncbi:MAG: DUF5982 domain-containing protein [Sulfurimonadaceae bacterium]